MKILPSLMPFRSLGIEPALLQTASLSSVCLWRMRHGLVNQPAGSTPDIGEQLFGLGDSQAVKSTLFEIRHVMKEVRLDTLLAPSKFLDKRMQQMQELLDDAKAHKDYLAVACREAIEQGVITPNKHALGLAAVGIPVDDATHDSDDAAPSPAG